MMERIRNQNWQFIYDDAKVKQSFKERFLDFIEIRYGKRIGEYRNYVMI